MAATTQVHVFHGAGPSATDITSSQIRFKRSDNSTVDALNPVPIPTISYNYSWRKHTKLSMQTAPANNISNLRFFSSGTSLGTGITHYVDLSASYVQGSSSDETAKISTQDVTTFTSGSPLTINSGTVATSSDSFPTYGTQNYIVHQMELSTTAAAGTSGQRTYTYRYDES